MTLGDSPKMLPIGVKEINKIQTYDRCKRFWVMIQGIFRDPKLLIKFEIQKNSGSDTEGSPVTFFRRMKSFRDISCIIARFLEIVFGICQYLFTVTLRDYPTPFHTSWRKNDMHTEIMHMRFAIPNLVYCVDS